jgi:uncharacterized protein (TIGR00369 family)
MSTPPEFETRRLDILKKLEGQHFMHHIGFEILSVKPGEVMGEMPLPNFTRQQLGLLHGGVTATVADIVAGFAAYSVTPLHQHVVTADINIMYYRPGQGDRLRAVGRVRKAGSKLHFCESEIWVRQGEEWIQIAHSTSTMAVIDAAAPAK